MINTSDSVGRKFNVLGRLFPTAKARQDAGISIRCKWDDDQSADVRYAHLADEEAARRYAKLLIHELAPNGFYSSRSCFLEVKDETGSLLFSIPFREIAADE